MRSVLYSGCARNTIPALHDGGWKECWEFFPVSMNLAGGSLLNCIQATGKYFPGTYRVQDSGPTAVNRTLSHAASMLERRADIPQK